MLQPAVVERRALVQEYREVLPLQVNEKHYTFMLKTGINWDMPGKGPFSATTDCPPLGKELQACNRPELKQYIELTFTS